MSFIDHVGGVAIYDDRSEDDTVDLAKSLGAVVGVRPVGAKAFLEDESRFREDGWRFFERALRPAEGDWVLLVDADEIVVGPKNIQQNTQRADTLGVSGLSVAIQEVFGWGPDRIPLVRVDGFWGQISGIRLVRYQPHGVFASSSLGGGSAPTYALGRAKAVDVSLLHYGYANEVDRLTKHSRYSGRVGHNPSHIESILRPGKLVPWA